ncbi:MAG: VanW like protein [Firmicutes bacterium]|nr:VanW like protein [Bacillota bacterium]
MRGLAVSITIERIVMQKYNRRLIKLGFFLGVIILFSIVNMLSINASFAVSDCIYSGVKVGDIDVGGLSEEAAAKKIAETFAERFKLAPITLTYQDKEWVISALDIDLKIVPEDLARKAYSVGRTGNMFKRLKDRYITINYGYTVPLTTMYNADKLQDLVTKISSSVEKEPINAHLTHNGSTVTLVPETVGVKVNIDSTLNKITATIKQHLPISVPLIVEEFTPEIIQHDLDGIDGVLASYTTQFDPWNKNRAANIMLAAKNLNGVLVHSGEQFSFNNRVGPRLAEYGYKVAPVFINGKLVPDWGGGVCQVTSTLYNAVLLADLAIEERTSHFRPPDYVPLGQDATVADNQLDFRFSNTSKHDIYLAAEVDDNQVSVYIYGKLQADSPRIEILSTDKKILEPTTIIKQDPELEFGLKVVDTEGQKGFQLNIFRVKYCEGKEIYREYLYTDEFPPEDRVIRVGTKKSNQIITK